MNDFNFCESCNISTPHAPYLHATYVPPRIRFPQVVHGHREHQLDGIIEDAHFFLIRVDLVGVVGAS